MPKLEPKVIQKELESGQLWPVYWLYGQERMKSRELLKRIRKAVLGDEASQGVTGMSFNEEVIDGTDSTGSAVLDAAQTLALGGGTRLVIIRDAHALKDSEALSPLLSPRATLESLASVCVFLSKDLDGRKKFSKLLTEKAAVVPCEEIPEEEREAWIQYLAKRRGMAISPELTARIRTLDPWTLDIVDLEIEKREIAQIGREGVAGPDEFFDENGAAPGPETFFEAFFGKDLRSALEVTAGFAESPDESLPLLGLLSWNVRHLTLACADREKGSRTLKLSPFLAERFGRWSRNWKLEQVLHLQSRLAELDFSIKQTPKIPLGLWAQLVMEFCQS